MRFYIRNDAHNMRVKTLRTHIKVYTYEDVYMHSIARQQPMRFEHCIYSRRPLITLTLGSTQNESYNLQVKWGKKNQSKILFYHQHYFAIMNFVSIQFILFIENKL